jgi:predicted metal-dependent HD superfamily phosphohydrolase
MLKDIFLQLTKEYTTDDTLAEKFWAEIEEKHTAKSRHYHTLAHLENLVNELSGYQREIADWNAILFAVFYHDSIYSVLKKDNEENSALLAEKRLTTLAVPVLQVEKCKTHILATKSHQPSPDQDTDLFTDADLSILGHPWPLYVAYYKQVRREYSIYPDLVYNPGRKKVLNHFLQMERIFKTEPFHSRYEQQARKNLQHELDTL